MRSSLPFPTTARVSLFLGLSSVLHAVELANLAGDWALTKLDTPTRLRETYFNPDTSTSRTSENSLDFAQPGEYIVDAFYPDPLSVSTVAFNFAANGSITGGETGTVVTVGSNRLTYTDGIDIETVYSNVTGDVLMASSRDEDQQNLSLCLKRPASLATSELAGTWNLVSFLNPDDISKNVTTRLVDTYFVGEPDQTIGTVTVDSSGNLGGLFGGSIAATGPGTANATVTGLGVIPFVVNASKNVLVATLDGGSDQEYIILVRKPDTLTTAELAGSWRFTAVRVPTTLIETFYNLNTQQSRQADSSGVAQANEELVDIYHPDPFELDRLTLQVQPSGDFIGSGTGTVTANGDQSVNVFIDGDNHTFQINADKTVMIGSVVEADAHELIVGIKTASAPAESIEDRIDLNIAPSPNGGPMVITWNSADNATLQGSNNFSTWEDIPEAAGSDSFAINPNEAGYRFFRVGVTPQAPE